MLLLQPTPQWDALFHSGELRTIPRVPCAWAKPVPMSPLLQQAVQCRGQIWTSASLLGPVPSGMRKEDRNSERRKDRGTHKGSLSQAPVYRYLPSPTPKLSQYHHPHPQNFASTSYLSPSERNVVVIADFCVALSLRLLVLPSGAPREQTASQHVFREHAQT